MITVSSLVLLVTWLVCSVVILAVLGAAYYLTRLYVKHFIFKSSRFDKYIKFRRALHERKNIR